MNAIQSLPGARKARIHPVNSQTNPSQGRVVWSPVKSLWFTAHALFALIGGWFTFSLDAVLVSLVFTVLTLCLGHTVGLHRLLVHRSFRCPLWLEYALVHLGTLVGMGGPHRILYMHDIRDWAQRQPTCHPFYTDQGPVWRDWFWQTHAELKLDHPPAFTLEPQVAHDPVYRWMQRTWMMQQLPWALLLYALGGWAWVVWGISMRIVVSLTGHWFIGYLAHNGSHRDWHLQGHAVQGYNLPHLGLITMGEGWHNNHHAYPESAKLGLKRHHHDPGWWFICLLKGLGLAWDIQTPETLPPRIERQAISEQHPVRPRAATFFTL